MFIQFTSHTWLAMMTPNEREGQPDAMPQAVVVPTKVVPTERR
jgi:hypothetical protein